MDFVITFDRASLLASTPHQAIDVFFLLFVSAAAIGAMSFLWQALTRRAPSMRRSRRRTDRSITRLARRTTRANAQILRDGETIRRELLRDVGRMPEQ